MQGHDARFASRLIMPGTTGSWRRSTLQHTRSFSCGPSSLLPSAPIQMAQARLPTIRHRSSRVNSTPVTRPGRTIHLPEFCKSPRPPTTELVPGAKAKPTSFHTSHWRYRKQPRSFNFNQTKPIKARARMEAARGRQQSFRRTFVYLRSGGHHHHHHHHHQSSSSSSRPCLRTPFLLSSRSNGSSSKDPALSLSHPLKTNHNSLAVD
ncbi:hypothetical protein EUGRSUZ_J01513 [Eucalyptus grandis]|uniref:Uncharacterized protein n=2 Tax=Eucalyptus grandis TaxID=71139 RepID=A0ACC3J6B8_EUCGR|nr:hypothetical protein EUGRSUZ_J01513 [Eucalyptus grandis]